MSAYFPEDDVLNNPDQQAQRSLAKINDMLSHKAGLTGSIYVTDTNQHDGNFAEIHAVATAVIATLTSTTMTGTLTSIPLNVGDSIYGRFQSFTLTSGKVVAYDAT